MRFLEPDQLTIARTAGGVLTLAVTGGQHYEHVDAYRVFPLSDGARWISLRVHGGAEIGILRRPEQLPEEQRRLLAEALERRYFAPRILDHRVAGGEVRRVALACRDQRRGVAGFGCAATTRRSARLPAACC